MAHIVPGKSDFYNARMQAALYHARKRRRARQGEGGVTPPPPFSPADIPNLALWLDAADPDHIAQVGGSVSKWDDKSGNGNHATNSVESEQPTTGTQTINGRNALAFNPALNQYMNLPQITYAGASGYTVFVVANTNSLATARPLLGCELVSARPVFSMNSSGFPYIISSAVAVRLTATTAITVNTPYIYTAQSFSGGNSLWLDGASIGNNTTNPAFGGGIRTIGRYPHLNQYFSGAIGEIVVYSRQLNAAEMNQVGQYLSHKWGRLWATVV